MLVDGCLQILHTFRDDIGRKGRVVGWLDPSELRQKVVAIRPFCQLKPAP
jgi:hypothetical protein